MRFEFDYELSEELIRRGALRYLAQRLLRPRTYVAPLVLILILIGVWQSEGAGFLAGVMFGVLLLYTALFAASVRRASRRTAQLVRKLGRRSASCILTDDGIGLENALSHSFLSWRLIRKVVRSRDVWLLFLSPQQYVTLPTDKLAGEAGVFVERCVSAAGGQLP